MLEQGGGLNVEGEKSAGVHVEQCSLGNVHFTGVSDCFIVNTFLSVPTSNFRNPKIWIHTLIVIRVLT